MKKIKNKPKTVEETIIELMEDGCEDHIIESQHLVFLKNGGDTRMGDALQFFIKDGEIKFVRSLKGI